MRRAGLAHRLAAGGRGYAPEVAHAAVDYGFDVLRRDELVAFTARTNLQFRRVMEKLGMHLDGAGEFDHPNLTEGDPRRRHVLYRLHRHLHPST